MIYNSESSLSGYVLNIFNRFVQDRQTVLEHKWEKNRAAFARDTVTFDAYAGAWRKYQAGGVQAMSEEQFRELGANDPAQAYDWHSDTFYSLTKQKVVAGANLANDQLFRGGDIPFSLDLFASHITDAATYSELDTRRQYMEETMKEDIRLTDSCVEMKKVVQSASLYGEGYFKMKMDVVPYVSNRYNEREKRIMTIHEEQDVLSGEMVSVWNIFRDLNYSDVKMGDGIIQRQFISLADMDDFIEAGEENYWLVDVLLSIYDSAYSDDGSATENYNSSLGSNTSIATTISPHKRYLNYSMSDFEYLECWIRVPCSLLDEFNCVPLHKRRKRGYSYALIGLLDEKIVRFAEIEADSIPFLKIDWERDPDDCPGIGVADNVEPEQKVLNGVIRSFEDNKKLTSNLLIAADKESLSGDWNDWQPGKQIDIDGARDINSVIQQFTVADVGQTLLGAVDMFLQFADMSSNIPRAQQGMPSGNPQTAFEIQQRLERSGKYIGNIISGIDDNLIRPFVERYYDFLCLEPDFEDMNGLFRVTPLGFASFESKSLKQQGLMMIFSLINQNPEFQQVINIQYFLREISKSQGLNPNEFIKSDEQLKQEQQQREASPEAQMAHRMNALQIEMLSKQVDELQSKINLNNAKASAELTDARIQTQEQDVSNSGPPEVEQQLTLPE